MAEPVHNLAVRFKKPCVALPPMDQRKKVIIKNTLLPWNEKTPWLIHRDQLGALIAEKGDVVVARKPPEEDLRLYLQDMNLIPADVIYLTRQEEQHNDQSDILFQDPHIINSISSFARTHELFTFYATEREVNFGKQVNLPLYGTPPAGAEMNNKSNFRVILKKLGIPTPFGIEFVSYDTLAPTLDFMFSPAHGHAIKCAVVKYDQGSAGLANTIIHRAIFTRLTPPEKIKFLQKKLWYLLLDNPRGAFTIEEWISPIVASPSIFFECNTLNQCTTVFLHDQVLTKFSRRYNGCSSLPEHITHDVRLQFETFARRALSYLSEKRYRGFAGFDAIISENNVMFVDANIRMVSGYFPHTAVRKIMGTRPTVYFNSNINVPLEYVFSVKRLLEFLQPLLYAHSRKEGVVILGSFPYQYTQQWYRHIDYLCIAQDHHSLQKITNELMRILLAL